MDYIMTDATTSPIESTTSDQYSEKLAYMPKTFFVGDHKQMFPHMLNKAVLVTKEKQLSRDNIIVANALDLEPLMACGVVSVGRLIIFEPLVCLSNSITGFLQHPGIPGNLEKAWNI